MDFPEIQNEGSSPRVWGQELILALFTVKSGIIPTRVGTSRQVLSVLHPLWDHPHACGDKRSHLFNDITSIGSSPRVWGQVIDKIGGSDNDRIIPTRVGTSFRVFKGYSTRWDHPHACGDKLLLRVKLNVDDGSSPRVWGQVFVLVLESTVKRIIPTRVGTRSLR